MQCKDQRNFIQPSALINDEKNSFIFYEKGFSYPFTNYGSLLIILKLCII